MQISAAILRDSSAISRALFEVFRIRARAAARANGPPDPTADNTVIRLNQVAGAGNQERVPLVGHDQQRFQVPQDLVGPPILRQLDRRPGEISMGLFELALEPRKKRKGVSGGTRKPGQDLSFVQTADLLGRAFRTVSPRVTCPSPAIATSSSLRTRI